jgi:hypothetical protein
MICAGRGLSHAPHFVGVICISDYFGSGTVMARKAKTRAPETFGNAATLSVYLKSTPTFA